jgi:hypothetical protein
MWIMIQELLPWFIFIIFVTQVVLPIIFDWPVFFLFRKTKKIEKTILTKPLEDEIEIAQKKVNETKEVVSKVQEKAKEDFNKAEELKKKTDNLNN